MGIEGPLPGIFKVNPDKSTCFCAGVYPLIHSQILSTLKMGEGKLPVRYLGVSLISSRLYVCS
jgi:hypothetical protein